MPPIKKSIPVPIFLSITFGTKVKWSTPAIAKSQMSSYIKFIMFKSIYINIMFIATISPGRRSIYASSNIG